MAHNFDICFNYRGENHSYGESFFLGGWHPSESIHVKIKDDEDRKHPHSILGKNWFLLSSSFDNNLSHSGLAHSLLDNKGEISQALLFSGYLLDEGLHSLSPSNKLFAFLKKNTTSNYNGIFSLVRISDSGKNIEIRSDAFGLSPLYYRFYKSMILFSSSPRFLRFDDDNPDYIAWRCLIQSRTLCSDRTLSVEIKRFPAGSVLQNKGSDYNTYSWFNYAELPEGSAPLNAKAVSALEESFRSSIQKCTKLHTGTNFLPLSSGHDSRRILALLKNLNVDFESATVRVFQKGYRDLDAKFSSLMAREFRFKHRVLDLPSVTEYVKNDMHRRIILDSEASLHTWYVTLLEALPQNISIVFDGLAGDVWGETGYENSVFHTGTRLQKTYKIAHAIINDQFHTTFNTQIIPSAEDIRQDISKYFDDIPDSPIFPDLAFLLTRTRRAISIGVQQLLPMGKIVVFPYMDLDYVKTALLFSPFEKLQRSIQARCLEKYWPDYFSYGGNRSFAKEIPKDGAHLYQLQLVGRFKQLIKEIRSQGGTKDLTHLLTKKSNMILLCAWLSNSTLLSREWHIMGLMELVARHSRSATCLKITRNSDSSN